MNTGVLIEDPNLDNRKEEERVAKACLRMIGDNLTPEDALFGEEVFRRIRVALESGEVPDEALLPQLSTIYPGDPQYVLISELTRLPTMMIKRMNRIPDKMRKAFLRLLNTTLIPAISATTTLRFKKLNGWLNRDLLIPAGSVIADKTSQIRVATNIDLLIPAGSLTGTVNATSLTGGNIGRINPGILSLLQSAVAGLIEITNVTHLTGGRDAESTFQAMIRARESLRIGQHLGAADDYVVHIFTTMLRGLGRVTPFEFYRSNFTPIGAGYLTLAIQAEDGFPPSDPLMAQIAEVIRKRHVAGIYVSAVPALYKQFSIEAQVTLRAGPLADATKAQAISNIKARYNPLSFRFGLDMGTRFIGLSDIAGAVEAAGQDQISINNKGNVFPITVILPTGERKQEDVRLEPGELPLLDQITLIPELL